MIGREGPGPERPGPDYPPEWDREPEEDPDAGTCRTCGAAIRWADGSPPGRPDLSGAWWDEEDRRGIRGPSGHEHQP